MKLWREPSILYISVRPNDIGHSALVLSEQRDFNTYHLLFYFSTLIPEEITGMHFIQKAEEQSSNVL